MDKSGAWPPSSLAGGRGMEMNITVMTINVHTAYTDGEAITVPVVAKGKGVRTLF